MISDYVITEHTASLDTKEAAATDPIAIAYWPTDTHCARRVIRNGVVHNEGFIFKDGHRWKPFGISYRAVTPRRSEARNVLSPLCPSSSHVGYGAIRLEHQFYALGQACALAADLCIWKEIDVQDLPYAFLASRMAATGLEVDDTQVGLPDYYPDEHSNIAPNKIGATSTPAPNGSVCMPNKVKGAPIFATATASVVA